MTTVEHVRVTDWRAAVEAALAAGETFAGAWASAGHWRALFTGARSRVLSCEAEAGAVPTIVDLVPAADWDEREAHDIYGLRFDGHEPMLALVEHPAELDSWVIAVPEGAEHQVAVGPIHAGIIEPGHFRFRVVGERILAIDLRLFYLHRGLERAAEGHDPAGARAFVQRACAACSVANTLAFAAAVESATGVAPDRDLRIVRTVLAELERIYNHLNDISAICAGVGFAPGTMAFAAFKDRAQRINELIGGHRFLFGAVAVGGGALAIDTRTADAARAMLRELRSDAIACWRDLEFAAPLQARLDGIAVLDRDTALSLGTVGPAARAAGVGVDVRRDSPGLWYPGFVPAAYDEPAGDVAARFRMRALELEASCEIVDELLSGPLAAGAVTAVNRVSEIGVGRVESPRGATSCAVELDAERRRVARVHLRTASYANWPSVARAAVGELLPDFPLINKSFELCYACVDR